MPIAEAQSPARGRPHPSDAARVLVVDDDPMVREALQEFLAREGHEVCTVATGPAALSTLLAAQEEDDPFGIALIDIHLEDEDGHQLLEAIVKSHRETAVIMLTGYGSVESAVRALRAGATDYLVKPFVDEELRQSLARAIRQRSLLADNQRLRRKVTASDAVEGVVGTDPRMTRVFEIVRAVAPTRSTVLMTGESGTGKSLIAHAIHELSPRRDRPYVELSCGSIPETLLESELFGHAKGAFTGAHADKAGRFLAANGGTIFLDEINSASAAMQLKLLRVLQERRFEPVGSSQTVEVDVRVLLATNQPLEHLVAQGLFRQDLYYRINVVQVELPALRDRAGDIPVLAQHFLEKHAAELGRQIVGFTPAAIDALKRYPFPGNIRELANIVERAALLTRSQIIEVTDLPDQVTHSKAAPPRSAESPAWTPMTLEQALREPERRILLQALTANGWNRQQTAEQLGINRTTLYKRMKALEICGPE